MHPRLRGLFESTPLFGGVRDDILKFILDRVVFRHFDTGDCIFEEGDEASSMFVIERGRVSVAKRWNDTVHRIKFLGPGDSFGEMALMDMHDRSATVTAVEDCETLELDRHVLMQLYEHDLEQFALIQMNIAREMCRRLRLADDQLFQARFGRQRPPDEAGQS